MLWYTIGAHHVVRPEDWPVMPVTKVGMHLRPFGFFDGNPMLDLPPERGHCAAGCTCAHCAGVQESDVAEEVGAGEVVASKVEAVAAAGSGPAAGEAFGIARLAALATSAAEPALRHAAPLLGRLRSTLGSVAHRVRG